MGKGGPSTHRRSKRAQLRQNKPGCVQNGPRRPRHAQTTQKGADGPKTSRDASKMGKGVPGMHRRSIRALMGQKQAVMRPKWAKAAQARTDEAKGHRWAKNKPGCAGKQAKDGKGCQNGDAKACPQAIKPAKRGGEGSRKPTKPAIYVEKCQKMTENDKLCKRKGANGSFGGTIRHRQAFGSERRGIKTKGSVGFEFLGRGRPSPASDGGVLWCIPCHCKGAVRRGSCKKYREALQDRDSLGLRDCTIRPAAPVSLQRLPSCRNCAICAKKCKQ